MGFIIFSAVIFLIILLMFLKIAVRVNSDDELNLTAKVGIFKIPILPAKDKQVRLRDYKIKKFRKNRARLEEKQRKKAEKKQLKAAEKSAKGKKASEVQKGKPKRDIKGMVSMISEIVKVFLARFGKHLHIEVKRLNIVVASPDAATTAVMYGGIVGAVQCLMELLYQCMHLKLPKNGEDIWVTPDFTREKPDIKVDIAFSFRVWQIFDIAIRSGFTFIKHLLNKSK